MALTRTAACPFPEAWYYPPRRFSRRYYAWASKGLKKKNLSSCVVKSTHTHKKKIPSVDLVSFHEANHDHSGLYNIQLVRVPCTTTNYFVLVPWTKKHYHHSTTPTVVMPHVGHPIVSTASSCSRMIPGTYEYLRENFLCS